MFPKNCCERCKRQLDRYKKSSTEVVPHSELACFSPPCETDCHVCKKTTVQSKGLSLKSIQISKKSDWLSSTLVKKKCKEYELFDTTVSSNVEHNRFCISKISWKDDIPVCQFTLQVSSDGSWLISVFNRKLISTPLDILERLNADSFDKLLSSMSSASVCLRNADFPDLINKKNTLASYEEYKNRKGEIIATLEIDQFSQISHLTTIRNVDCSVIIFTGERCDHCSKYRKTLNALSWKLKNIDASRTFGDESFSTGERSEKVEAVS